MKKLAYVLIGILLGSLIPIQSILAESPIRLIINGKEITCDVMPQMVNGRVLVPARFVAEPLGASVNWDSQQNAVIINSNLTNNQPQQNNSTNITTQQVQQSDNSTIKPTTFQGMQAIEKNGIIYFCATDYAFKIERINPLNHIKYDSNTKASTIFVNSETIEVPYTDENVQIYLGLTYFNSKFYR